MKKNIIISREGGDFSMDLVFAGLVRKFGKESIIDWPNRAKHRQGKPKLVGDIETDYGSERRSLCYVDGCENLKEYGIDEIIKEIDNDNIEYIFVDERQETYELYKEIVQNKDVKTVVVAGHDMFQNHSPEYVRRTYYNKNLVAMFVDDWKMGYDNLPYIHLINLSCNFDHLWDSTKREQLLQNKVYDLCFIGYNSNNNRALILDHIIENYKHLNNCIILEKRQDTFDMFMTRQEYFEKMAQSKICINVAGASTYGRALRYYEIPYIGSCMLTQTFPAKLLNKFEQTNHCVYFDSLDELDNSIKFLLEKEHIREAIAKCGHNHYQKYHTIDARMDYVFDILNN